MVSCPLEAATNAFKASRLAYPDHVVVRFQEKVEKRGPDECWPWTASRNKHGYGKFKVDGSVQNASRIAIEIHTGKRLPPGAVSRHSCDNPPCCNPGHLSAGTQSENLDDARQRGRYRNSHTGKLNGRPGGD